MRSRLPRDISLGQQSGRRMSSYVSGRFRRAVFSLVILVVLPSAAPRAAEVETVPGMPAVIDPANLYSEAGAGKLSPAVMAALTRIYVPNVRSNDVYVIDPEKLQVIDRYKVGPNPEHVVPSWDLQTLWVTNNARRGAAGSLTPIDPKTGKPGPEVPVNDPYNMYFTPDGKSAIIVAERLRRLDFRDPHTMKLQYKVPTPGCRGINHADFSVDGRYAIFTCEFNGALAKIDLVHNKVVGYLALDAGSMPQDIRISPDGQLFYVADMHEDGVFLIDGDTFKIFGFLPTGVGPHGLYPSRDGM
jgi:YVTN family beta-propeller protein